MKFVILADIHLGPEGTYKGVLRKMNKNAKVFLDKFIKEINENIKPDFVVILGDLIQDDNKTKDIENIEYITNSLTKLECPVHYVAGNHDLRNISEEELAKSFEQDNLYYSFDVGNYHSILLFSKVTENEKTLITDEQKAWLKQDLNKTNKKCIVFVHHGLAEQDLTGNPWFEGRTECCLIENRIEIRNIISNSQKVIAVFNGHLHWDKYHVHDQVPYFTIQSFTENEADKGIASEAYAISTIVDDKIKVEIKGNYPKGFIY